MKLSQNLYTVCLPKSCYMNECKNVKQVLFLNIFLFLFFMFFFFFCIFCLIYIPFMPAFKCHFKTSDKVHCIFGRGEGNSISIILTLVLVDCSLGMLLATWCKQEHSACMTFTWWITVLIQTYSASNNTFRVWLENYLNVQFLPHTNQPGTCSNYMPT